MTFPQKLGLALLLFTSASLASAAAPPPTLFDSHVHLWKGEESLGVYRQQLKEAHLEVAGIGAMWFGGPNQALAGDPAAIQAGNDSIIALAAKHPEVMPIATVHPYDGAAAVKELERVAAKGIKVLKLHPHTQKFDAEDPRVLTLVQRAGELGVITLMDNASIVPDDCEKLFNLALKAPKTKFIFAHLGAMNFRFWNIIKAARTAQGLFGENIYFDISATVAIVADSPIQAEFVWTMRNVGIDHLLLGSDYPQYTLAQNVNALSHLGLKESELAKIRYENARKLFGLK
ncbi:MAG TPA: amidohydrolase family protein [Opitutaceae bacterium]|nr:amidohydrolase family protein [Opitutaceae bacterium]